MGRVQRADAWGHGQVVTHFFTNSGYVEPYAHDEFRRLAMEQQRQVMNFGPLRSGDPSKELIARVRDIGSRGGADRIASFCRENGIDEQAEQVLRNCRAEVQKVVFDEGQVLGTKNPSAVLMSRIRTAEKRGR